MESPHSGHAPDMGSPRSSYPHTAHASVSTIASVGASPLSRMSYTSDCVIFLTSSAAVAASSFPALHLMPKPVSPNLGMM
jgi:hypothetical protein